VMFDVKANKPEGTTSAHRAGTKFAVTCGVHDIKFCDEPPISDRAS
jgi:hypothetical protein